MLLRIILALVFVFAVVRVDAAKSYKQHPRDQVTRIARGRVAAAERYWEGYLRSHPDDLEAHYGLAICYAHQGRIDAAMAMAKRGVAKGLPFGRFLAGPRDLLKPLTDSGPFEAWAKAEAVELIHGPMLGGPTDRGVRVWVRTWHEVPVEVRVARGKDFSQARVGQGRTSAARDFTTVVDVAGLEPSTTYDYQLTVAGNVLPKVYRFTTMPAAGAPAKFTIFFGGGAGYTPAYERMWDVIKRHEPLAYLALGDNVYIDTPEVQATQQYCYYRRQSRAEYRRLVASTPVFAIWDDHDFVVNDGEGGPAIDHPPWKRAVWQTFCNNFVNPAYGGGAEQPGCWFTCSIADVDFFFLDGRYYRSHKDATMLGPVQKTWLFDALRQSNATFKVLCCDVPMSHGIKPGSKDPWDGFPEEREEIFRFVERQRIEGLLVIASDRHRSDAWKTPRTQGYPIYEFQSSRLTNVHTHKLIDGCLFGYNKKCSFGLLTFDTTAADPEVTYQVVSIDDEPVGSLTIQRSELSFARPAVDGANY
jgi:alkaline phosphatase D